MKKLVFIVLAIVSVTAYAQRSPVQKFIKKYAKGDGVEVQKFEPGSKEFSAEFNIGGDELEEAFAQIDLVKVINTDSTMSIDEMEKLHAKASEALSDEQYSELARVNDGDDDVGIYANTDDNGLIREFVLLVKETDEMTMVYIDGKIDMSKFAFSEIIEAISGKGECEKEHDHEHEHDHDHDHDNEYGGH